MNKYLPIKYRLEEALGHVADYALSILVVCIIVVSLASLILSMSVRAQMKAVEKITSASICLTLIKDASKMNTYHILHTVCP